MNERAYAMLGSLCISLGIVNTIIVLMAGQIPIGPALIILGIYWLSEAKREKKGIPIS